MAITEKGSLFSFEGQERAGKEPWIYLMYRIRSMS